MINILTVTARLHETKTYSSIFCVVSTVLKVMVHVVDALSTAAGRITFNVFVCECNVHNIKEMLVHQQLPGIPALHYRINAINAS